MDAIQSIAVATFEQTQKFHDGRPAWHPGEHDCLQIAIGDGTDAVSTKSRKHESMLVSWIQMPSPQLPGASLKMVGIRREPGASLHISKAGFSEVFDAMKADPAVKYLICQDYDGFHEFHGAGYLITRFIGTYIYALLWTFDPATLATTALLIARRHNPFDHFEGNLRAYRNYIYSSWLPAFVSCHVLLQFSDRETETVESKNVRFIERRTGFCIGPPDPGLYRVQLGGFLNLDLKFDINKLTQWSQMVNEVAGRTTNKMRHQRTSKSVLALIAKDHRSNHLVDGLPDHMVEKSKHALDQLGRAVPLLERQLDTYLDYLAYLHDRAERLSAVLFALLTHEDAAASVELAAASKRDSSSMKTVAIMTMAFLPATFFAALFAVPSLRWDQNVVMQENFWVYWAFTLPSTAAVFLIWIVINNWRAWMPAIRNHWARPKSE